MKIWSLFVLLIACGSAGCAVFGGSSIRLLGDNSTQTKDAYSSTTSITPRPHASFWFGLHVVLYDFNQMSVRLVVLCHAVAQTVPATCAMIQWMIFCRSFALGQIHSPRAAQ